jgi:hypothetical protein
MSDSPRRAYTDEQTVKKKELYLTAASETVTLAVLKIMCKKLSMQTPCKEDCMRGILEGKKR